MNNTIVKIFKFLIYLPSILRFNFHYLPWKQAIKLPFVLYKPHLIRLKGKITLKSQAKYGMVRLGYHGVSIYPDTGIIFENNGGEIVVNGPCTIGAASAISIGPNGLLELGNGLMANAAIKIVCYNNISIGEHCRIGWETMILDTDFHALTRPDGSLSRGYGTIKIGNNCWIGTGCLLLKNTELPAYTTAQARSILSKKIDCPERCVIGSDSTIVVKATNTYRDLDNDAIHYSR